MVQNFLISLNVVNVLNNYQKVKRYYSIEILLFPVYKQYMIEIDIFRVCIIASS